MKRNVLAYCLGALALAVSSAHAQPDSASSPAQRSSADRATEKTTGAAGAPSMTPPVESVTTAPGHTPATAEGSKGGLPEPQQQNGVTYITGGFGDNESEAFKAAMADYSVGMVFSESGGAYLADIPVQIKGAGGTNVDIKAAGPYLLMNLPEGKYTAIASHQGKSMNREFSVSGQKGQRISFTW